MWYDDDDSEDEEGVMSGLKVVIKWAVAVGSGTDTELGATRQYPNGDAVAATRASRHGIDRPRFYTRL